MSQDCSGALGEWLEKYPEKFKPDTTIVILDPDMLFTDPPFDEV